ncbi:MAG TPA: hypothetical protein VIA18_28845 [Polyangia bacterium]|nr:hypothetical protein [Polyangia bacterium]
MKILLFESVDTLIVIRLQASADARDHRARSPRLRARSRGPTASSTSAFVSARVGCCYPLNAEAPTGRESDRANRLSNCANVRWLRGCLVAHKQLAVGNADVMSRISWLRG